jgi:hypothetical protein
MPNQMGIISQIAEKYFAKSQDFLEIDMDFVYNKDKDDGRTVV